LNYSTTGDEVDDGDDVEDDCSSKEEADWIFPTISLTHPPGGLLLFGVIVLVEDESGDEGRSCGDPDPPEQDDAEQEALLEVGDNSITVLIVEVECWELVSYSSSVREVLLCRPSFHSSSSRLRSPMDLIPSKSGLLLLDIEEDELGQLFSSSRRACSSRTLSFSRIP